jgi:sortase A
MMKKTNRKASNLWGIAAVVLLIGSIALLLYPFVSKELNQQKANHIIEDYNAVIEKIRQNTDSETENSISGDSTDNHSESSKKITDYVISNSEYSLTPMDIEALYKDSISYNDALKKSQIFDNSDFSLSALNLYDYGIYNGVYGYISIPAINLQMPILLGSTNNNMAIGVTHLYSTSLPTGGNDTNCVISGHTGFTGRIFFDEIPNLQSGDSISVTTFFGTLDYKVDNIKKIDITETNDLYIEKGRDKLTLLTCADGGSRRWQVTCYRNNGVENK